MAPGSRFDPWPDWPPSEDEVDRQFARIPPPLELPEEEPPLTYVPTPTMGEKEET